MKVSSKRSSIGISSIRMTPGFGSAASCEMADVPHVLGPLRWFRSGEKNEGQVLGQDDGEQKAPTKLTALCGSLMFFDVDVF